MIKTILEPSRVRHRGDRLKDYIARNRGLPCSVPACPDERDGASCYCKSHRPAYRDQGHPTMSRPTPAEILAVERVILAWLEGLPEREKDALEKSWSRGVVSLKRHPSYAVPFSTLEGHSGYTQRSKGDVYLAHYQKQGHPLAHAILRYMAYRLYAELRFWTPPGKISKAAERTKWVNLHSGRFVTHRAHFNRTIVSREIVGVQRVWWKNSAEPDAFEPIIETRTKVIRKEKGMAGIRRAIGSAIGKAVETAVGTLWVNSLSLQDEAEKALQELRNSHH